MQRTVFTFAVAAAALLLDSASAHSYLVKPVSRVQSSQTDMSNSMGCPSPGKGTVTSFEAGEKIDVKYWRNNHLGGFIRWSIVPAGQETKANFDKNAFYYTCRESGPTCLPKGQNTKYAGDSSGSNTISCGDSITLPDWLPAGDYTLQWMWFGVGSSYGNLGWAEPQFKSCADLRLTTAGIKTSAPKCPTFVGGDRVTKLENQGNDKCFYFRSTSIETGTSYKGDNSKAQQEYKFGIPADVAKCNGGGAAAGGDTDADSGAASNSSTPAVTSKPPAPATRVPTPASSPVPPPTSKTPVAGEASAPPSPAKTPSPAKVPSSKCGVKRS
jgi:hypothetical protein